MQLLHYDYCDYMLVLETYTTYPLLQEKELLQKKREEVEEAERAKRSKVVVTFDLLGRKVSNFHQMA